ncbi:MAG TPA: BamA/TamA family outer membrane protein [Vicinamibacterales bacterium]
MSLRLKLASAVALALAVSPALAQEPGKPEPKSDLDAFMERALERRDVDRKVLNDYILDEREEFEILGPGRYRLHRTSREYTWFVRDGIHVRSPLRFEGVTIPEEDRRAYEEKWLRREKERRERQAKGEQEKQDKDVTIGGSGVSADVGGPAVPTEPRFVSEAYFMDFKFEPGNYYLAGREQFEGQEVLKVEYYPTKLFGGKDDEKTPRELRKDRTADRERQLEQDIERKMNQTSLITLWVDPKTYQIVKYTFDNVWLDFLPAAWLVRVDAMRASMTMFQPFEGVWLPRAIDISAGITLANGSFSASYTRAFHDYREADVQTRIKKKGTVTFFVSGANTTLTAPPPIFLPHDTVSDPGGPFALEDQQLTEKVTVPFSQAAVVREVRVHGNAAVPEEEVLRIAGVQVGTPLEPDAVAAIERRLKSSGRFETVQVRIRYRSLTDPTDVALLLVVHEKTGVTMSEDGQIERPISRRITSRIMFLPILSYADGYGFTYGARFSTVDLLGAGERLSVPLTWGGTRRAALEAERTFDRGPFTRLLGSAALWQRENPRHEIDDRRIEFRGRLERSVAEIVYAGIEATRADVDFGGIDDRLWTVGADVALDTRGNPAFPANAVYLGAGWTSLNVDGSSRATGTGDRINRYTLDGRGYVRVFRQMVLAGRARYTTADAPLPIYERWLIGGSETLRGFRAGAFEGDKALVTSAELRIPITSVLNGSKLGLNVFMDAAKTTDYGASLDEARWERGAGAGLFLIASIVRLNLDVARALDGGGTRVHFATGFGF